MKNCRDCLHFKACYEMAAANNADEFNTMFAEKCEDFTNSSEWVHLPCRVGDTIYYPWLFNRTCGIAVGEVESIKIYAGDKPLFTAKDWESDMPMQGTFILADFGDVVFLDYDDAEKALERMKDEWEL